MDKAIESIGKQCVKPSVPPLRSADNRPDATIFTSSPFEVSEHPPITAPCWVKLQFPHVPQELD